MYVGEGERGLVEGEGEEVGGRRELVGHTGGVVSMDVSMDGGLVVSGSMDGKVCVWDVGSMTLLRSFTGHKGPVSFGLLFFFFLIVFFVCFLIFLFFDLQSNFVFSPPRHSPQGMHNTLTPLLPLPLSSKNSTIPSSPLTLPLVISTLSNPLLSSLFDPPPLPLQAPMLFLTSKWQQEGKRGVR